MTRLVVVAGRPTDTELAAIVTAFVAHAGPTNAVEHPRESAWVRAARLEGCGHQPIDDPSLLPPS